MVRVPGDAACAEPPRRPEESGSAAAPASCSTVRRETTEDPMTLLHMQMRERRPQWAPLTELFDYLAACGALSAQRAISVFDGRPSSTSFFADATPATGSSAGSSSPICTSTEARTH